MFKNIILILLVLLTIPFCYSEEYYTEEIQNLYNITKCQGPIKIKTIGITDIKFDRCQKVNDLFECRCSGDNFNINFLTEVEGRIIVNIEYYTKYNESIEESVLENNKHNLRLENIRIVKKDKTIVDKIDIDPSKALFMGGFVALLLMIIIFKKYKKKLSIDKYDNDDVLNYISTDKEMDDILKKL